MSLSVTFLIHDQLKSRSMFAVASWELWLYLNVLAFMLYFCTLPGHYGMAGSQDMHNFLSSGFLTLGRGHLKGKTHQNHFIITFLWFCQMKSVSSSRPGETHTLVEKSTRPLTKRHSDTSASAKAARHTAAVELENAVTTRPVLVLQHSTPSMNLDRCPGRGTWTCRSPTVRSHTHADGAELSWFWVRSVRTGFGLVSSPDCPQVSRPAFASIWRCLRSTPLLGGGFKAVGRVSLQVVHSLSVFLKLRRFSQRSNVDCLEFCDRLLFFL